MYKILIIEDDTVIANTVQEHLTKWGYDVCVAQDFANVMKTFVEYEPQLVLLDISVHFFNGYHWCTQIRAVSQVPIIFLSSMADNMNIVMAMNMGGDDFVAKPFDLNVLVAKVQAILRRTYDFVENTNVLEHNGGILNRNDQTFLYENQKVELTKNEFKILQMLMEHSGTVVSRDEIMMQLWESEDFIDDNTLTVNVTRLRKKLEAVGLAQFIKTKKGVGYVIE